MALVLIGGFPDAARAGRLVREGGEGALDGVGRRMVDGGLG